MMRTFTLFLLLIATLSIAQAQETIWANSIPSAYQNEVKALKTWRDSLYVAGTFRDTADFLGTDFKVAGNSEDDGYVALLDEDGNIVWYQILKAENPSAKVNIKTIAVDEIGGVYICGEFRGTVELASGETITETNGKNGFFVAKYDSSGNFRWKVAQAGSTTALEYKCKGISYYNGKLAAAGELKGGAGTFGSFSLSNSGTKEVGFIVLMDSAGVVQDAKTVLTVTSEGASLEDIAMDATHIYIAGQLKKFSGTVGSGTTITLSNTSGKEQMAVAKLDLSGNAIWAYTATSSAKNNAKLLDISSGNVLVSGDFEGGGITFNEANSLTGYSTKSSYLVSYSKDGAWQWGTAPKSNDASSEAKFTNLCIADGKIWAAGEFRGEIYFGSFTPMNAGFFVKKGFIVRFDSDGTTEFSYFLDSDSEVKITSIAVDPSGNQFIGGSHSDKIYLPSPANELLHEGGLLVKNGFIVKGDFESTLVSAVNDKRITDHSVKAYPNPLNDHFKIEHTWNTEAELIVYNLYGKEVLRQTISEQYPIVTISGLTTGVYVCHLFNNSKRAEFKITVQE
jgi:hypothetical protein